MDMTASAARNLPEWNLADLYTAPDAAAFTADMQRGEAEAKKFAEKFKGKLAGLSGTELAGVTKPFPICSGVPDPMPSFIMWGTRRMRRGENFMAM
jgi:oligoendopeptidase F